MEQTALHRLPGKGNRFAVPVKPELLNNQQFATAKQVGN
jgi:hypothetical protein